MNCWVVVAVAALWLIRVGVEARRWYWQGEVERLEREADRLEPRSHVTLRADPFDQDRSG